MIFRDGRAILASVAGSKDFRNGLRAFPTGVGSRCMAASSHELLVASSVAVCSPRDVNMGFFVQF